MDISYLIFEKGISLHKDDSNHWWYESSQHKTNFIFANFQEVRSQFGVNPIVATEVRPVFGELDLLLDSQEFPSFLSANYLQSCISTEKSGLTDIFLMKNLDYVLNASIYHCIKLAKNYVSICSLYSRVAEIINNGSAKSGFSSSLVMNAYFEFDALISALLRAYNTIRYLLWEKFNGKGSTPSSYYRVLEKCKSSMSQDLYEVLGKSWHKNGEKLKSYRDCIQHYVPIEKGFSQANIVRNEKNIWLVSLLLPDNPDAQSITNFKYSEEIDALSYCWYQIIEFFRISKHITSDIDN